jgi:nucleotide-binding universal stress UspA family protein
LNFFKYLGAQFYMVKNQKNKSMNKDFRRIIVPVDGSKSSKLAVKKAIDFAHDSGIELTALYVLHEPDAIYPEFGKMYPDAVELMKKEGYSILKDIEKMGSEKGIDVKTKLVVGILDQEIIKEAGKNDLIVIGCKGQSVLSRILIGSLCERILHHSSSNVMIIR